MTHPKQFEPLRNVSDGGRRRRRGGCVAILSGGGGLDTSMLLSQSVTARTLQNMWAQGSVVLMWRNAAVEFYYSKLSAGRTHVAVDGPTLLERVEWLRSHDEEVRPPPRDRGQRPHGRSR